MLRVPNLNLTRCDQISDISSEGEFVPNPEYEDFCIKLPISEENETRSLLFRRTPNGIIVYDSKARYSDDDRPNIQMRRLPKDLTEDIQRDAEKCPEFGTFHPDRVKFLTSPAYLPQKYIHEEYTLVIPSAALRFDSKFESGNLARAVMLDEDDYELLLDYDTETKGYTQWYYFSVVSRKPSQRVRFSIVNLMKYESLYNNGLQPLVKVGQGEWTRGGNSIAYYQNSLPRHNPNHDPKVPSFHYTLTFTYELASPGEPVYFAHCYPYTYTDLLTYIHSLQLNPALATRLRVDTLCKSLGGNDCPLLTITDHVESYIPWTDEETIMMKSAAGRKFLRQRAYRLDKSAGKQSDS